jgi:hypothetical protein
VLPFPFSDVAFNHSGFALSDDKHHHDWSLLRPLHDQSTTTISIPSNPPRSQLTMTTAASPTTCAKTCADKCWTFRRG